MVPGRFDLHGLHLDDVVSSLGYVFAASVALLAFYSVGKIIYNLYFHPLAKIPGPKLFAATPVGQSWLWATGNDHNATKALHDKYGEVVRIAPDSVSFIGAQAWKDIYGYKQIPQIPKDMNFYNRIGQKNASDIIASNDADHSRYRRSLSHAFSDKALRSSEPILTHYFDLLISSLKERAASPSTSIVDLSAWYNWTTFDIIGDLAFGEPFHALDRATYHPYITGFFKGFRLNRWFRILRQYGLDGIGFSIVNFAAKYNKGVRDAVSSMQRKYSAEIIARRLSPEKMMSERQDFLYHVLRQEGEKGLTRKELEMNSSILVLAGSETTATFLSGTTFHLLKTPNALKALQDEVRGRFKSADEITLASTVATEMPYLHAVIEEGLRMYPPVPARLPRRTKEDMVLNGIFVPANTAVGVHQYSSSTYASYFHSPNSFAPERWLPTPPSEFANDILDSNQPFSTGPRNCLGRNLAYGEMRCILARMVWNFDMWLDGRSEGWDRQKSFVLWEKGALMVGLGLREGA